MAWFSRTARGEVSYVLPPTQLVSALPAAPADGQEVYLQTAAMATDGIAWHMRYRAAGTHWDFVGGADVLYRQEGTNAAYAPTGNTWAVYTNAANTTPLQWTYTPPINVFAEVEFYVGLMHKLDAAYHYAQLNGTCSPSPASGTSPTIYKMQHVNVQTFDFYSHRKVYGLTAGVAYTMGASWTLSGGSWEMYQGPNALWMTGKAWPR